MLSYATFPNYLPQEERGILPRGILYRKTEPFDGELLLPLIIPAMAEKSLQGMFRAILNLFIYVKQGLCPKGASPLGILHMWCSCTSDMVTASSAENPRALHPDPMPIGF